MGKVSGLLVSALYRSNHIVRHFCRSDVWGQFQAAANHYGSSTPAIAWKALRLYGAGRFLPGESLCRGLLDPRLPVNEHLAHVSEERLHGLQHAVNSPHAAMCRDKLMFHDFCRSHDLPVAALFGVVSRHGSRDAQGEPLSTPAQWEAFVRRLPASFLAKPRHGRQGRGIVALGLDAREGTALPEFAKEVAGLADDGEDRILEQRLRSHDRVAELTGTRSISALRLFTRVSPEGDPEVLDCHFRLIVGDSVTDNISDPRTGRYTANVVALPQLDDGRLGKAWAFNANGLGYNWVTHHPTTGALIEGFEVPFWAEALQLVKTAARDLLPIRTAGWDVALTPNGPVLIEVNERFQHVGFGDGIQRIRQALLADKRYLETAGLSCPPSSSQLH